MSSFEINKIAGAILTVALVAMVIGIIGDALVKPKDHKSSIVVADAPAPVKKEEKKLEPIGPLLASADVEKGKKVANLCKACHTFDKGGKHKIGPALWETVGREMGGGADFKYSSGMMKMKASWGYEELNKFLLKPRTYVKGTKMAFVGIKKAKDRANLIAYLRSLSDSPKPLP
jgi:cytochrome c